MPLPIFLTARAQRDVDEAYEWWSSHRSAEQAQRWRDRCVEAIDSLAANGAKCGPASENDSFPIELRQLAFGLGRRPSHRILFNIRPEMVLVLRVQHLAQDRLSLEEF